MNLLLIHALYWTLQAVGVYGQGGDIAAALQQARDRVTARRGGAAAARGQAGAGGAAAAGIAAFGAGGQAFGGGPAGAMGDAGNEVTRPVTGHSLFTRRNDPPTNERLAIGGEVLSIAAATLSGGGAAVGAAAGSAAGGQSPDLQTSSRAAGGFTADTTTAFRNLAAPNCMDEIPAIPCDPQQRYRETDGQCNNLIFQSIPSMGFKLGASFTAQGRFLSPDYDDGFTTPRQRSVVAPFLLPNARDVSIAVHSGFAFTSDRHTTFLTHFGQFIDHDIVSTPNIQPSFMMPNSHCCLEPAVEECFNINFAFTPVLGGSCIPFPRAAPSPDFFCNPGPRLQQNQRTSFVDGTMVYGWNVQKENELRIPHTAFLFSDNDFQLKLVNNNPEEPLCFPFSSRCFDAGDHRSSETATLTVMHIIFVRRHNLIVGALRSIPGIPWTPELLFQEAKRIVIAELQHITYNEFLPRVLDFQTYIQNQLFSSVLFANPYSPLVDPRTTSGFSTAAYRFGHSLVRNVHDQIGPNGFPVRNHLIQDQFDRPETHLNFFPGGATEAFVRWMAGDPKSRGDRTLVDGLQNNLFRCNNDGGPLCLNGGGATQAFDLAALNIQRARDHGVPSYTRWRFWCTGRRTLVFTPNAMGLSDHSPFEANILRNTYRHVDDIDLFSGAMTETHRPGALVGPTFACIIAAQFANYKRGDRFWYERPDPNLGFTPGQLSAIKQTTLAKIICSTMRNLPGVQRQVMDVAHHIFNRVVDCSILRNEDLLPQLRIHWNNIPPNAIRSAAAKARQTNFRFRDRFRFRNNRVPFPINPSMAHLFSAFRRKAY